MELSLVEIWHSMGFLARAVAIALFGMGLVSLALGFERLLVLGRAQGSSARFAEKARSLIDARELEHLLDLSRGREFAPAPLARLTRVALEVFEAQKADRGLGPVELTKRELARKLELMSVEVRRGMGFLASTGSTAPFIGLFGTVIGIITAFQGIATSGGGGIAAVSAGIAEALIVTAVGLFVAISAVLLFNFLTARFERLDMNLQHAASELVDLLETCHGNAARG